MEKLTRNLTIGLIVLIALIGAVILKMPSNPINLSGVAPGGEYNYQSFSGTSIATTTVLKTGWTVFGSVIITEDFAGAVTIYDATSTTAYSITNATTVAVLQSALTEGVYTFDTVLNKGLVVSSADGFVFAGDMTVTWR